MAIVLSLLSALAYGVSDFVGGLVAKRASAWQVAVVGQLSATAFTVLAAAFVDGSPRAADWCYAAPAGLAMGVGAAFLYRGLATARMSVVAPLSAIGAALLPVVVGVAQGDRPSTVVVVGVVLAFPAIALISRVVDDSASHRSGVVDGLVAGLGFGLMFVLLGQLGDDAGLMPLALTQAGGVVGVVVAATVLRQAWVPRQRAAWRALAMGPLGAAAVALFLLATREGLLSVVSVISSLYPASTVLLAAVVLHERVQRSQGVGLAFAVLAVALVATG